MSYNLGSATPRPAPARRLEIDDRLQRYPGPRFSPDITARLRRVACPLAAAALTLARATDNNAPWLAGTRTER